MRIILTLLLLIISTQTSSGFLNNRQEWETMPELKQTGYVMGVVDEMIQPISSDIPKMKKILFWILILTVIGTYLYFSISQEFKD
jgi:hypothetical protein